MKEWAGVSVSRTVWVVGQDDDCCWSVSIYYFRSRVCLTPLPFSLSGGARAFSNTAAVSASVGKITQVIGAVVDVQVRDFFIVGVGESKPCVGNNVPHQYYHLSVLDFDLDKGNNVNYILNLHFLGVKFHCDSRPHSCLSAYIHPSRYTSTPPTITTTTTTVR
jgi:hypothetical protein